MQALVITTIGETAFRTVDPPTPAKGEVLLRVGHVGLCGSDLNTFRGLNPLSALPRIPGHEIGGTILEAGADVPAEFAPGKRAIVIPYTACGTCSACRRNRPNACKNNQTLGVQRDGGMSDLLCVPHDKLILNDSLSLPQLALVEPLSVGFHAVKRGRVTAQETVLVLGAGMIGVGAALGALARGARVIVSEVSDTKSAALKALGVSAVINPMTEDLPARIAELTEGHGADVVIEAVGLPETFRGAVDMACFAGRVVYVGYAKAEVSYNTALFNLKELDIMGSRNAMRADFDAVIAYLETRPDLPDLLISRTFPWAEADQSFRYWEDNRQETFKVMIDMQDASNG
ncbi:MULTISPECIES: zinc-binding alcohol dehydrogenase family protein [unclassified Mameliella]|uniref:zinc-binding alcohol dehydrogenase family protein n=1 Tax=unclassified Mameliella TaxID=2630630 RepID=UPI00273ED69D|nr:MULTISPECIES: zinc-binding alcohol dehydrogenase family protein [unclassified Mameliella]